jgi:hypothetical protein
MVDEWRTLKEVARRGSGLKRHPLPRRRAKFRIFLGLRSAFQFHTE